MAVALQVIQTTAADTCDCQQGKCRFRVPLIRFYLFAYRQSIIAREPFADVLSDCIQSRGVDAGIRAGRMSRGFCHEIAMSLEMVRDQHGIELTTWNAERLAAKLCPLRWDETS